MCSSDLQPHREARPLHGDAVRMQVAQADLVQVVQGRALGPVADAKLVVQHHAVGQQGAPGAPLTLSTTVTSRRAGFPRLACTGEALVFAWTEPGDASRVRSARLPLTSLPR